MHKLTSTASPPPVAQLNLPADSPKTFVRGLQILQTLQFAGEQGIDIPTLARQTGTQRPTVYRYLDVLVAMGYAKRLGQRPIYAYQNPPQPTTTNPDQALLKALKTALRRISDQTQDSTFLVQREGDDALCIHRELGAYPVQVLAVHVGHTQPMGVGAAGLALLAYLPAHDIENILTHNEERLLKYGGMTRKKMTQLIKTTQMRGWAAVGNAAVPGVLGVGIPVPYQGAYPRFAVSVSGLMNRLPLPRQREIITLIRSELNLALKTISPQDD